MSTQDKITTLSKRQKKLVTALKKSELNALAINPGPSLTYLTGLHFHLMERPIVFIFTPDEAITAIIPELEAAKLRGIRYEVHPFFYGENPAEWGDVFAEALVAAGLLSGDRIGVEPGRLRLLELRYLENASPGSSFIFAEDIISNLRMYKDANEIIGKFIL